MKEKGALEIQSRGIGFSAAVVRCEGAIQAAGAGARGAGMKLALDLAGRGHGGPVQRTSTRQIR